MTWPLLSLLLSFSLVAVGCAFSAPKYKGPKSNHFDGERFHNAVRKSHGKLADLIRWQWQSKRGPWSRYTDAAPGPKPPERVSDGKVRVTFVNHATVLLQVDGLNLLTDPIWSDRCSPVSFAGPKRVRPPGIRFEDLPPIDAVLVSHSHYDHLDLPTLKRLEERFHPRNFAGLGNAALLTQAGHARPTDLDWWESVPLAPTVKLTAVPAQHFANRGLTDTDATLWLGYVLETSAGKLYFAGDTGFGPHFAQIRERFGPVRLALLPIGAFLPTWFMQHVHISPEEALTAHGVLEAQTSVGIHYGTFPLADDGEHEPVARLQKALAERGAGARFWTLGFGEGREVP